MRGQILAHARFFVAQGFVEATWRTYRGRRLGPYFTVSCRQRGRRRDPCAGAAPQQTSIYLGRSPELAARVRRLLDELRQHTRCKRRCEETRRQIRRSLTRAKEALRQRLAEHGVALKGSEFRGAARAFGRLAQMPRWGINGRDPTKSSAPRERWALVHRQGRIASGVQLESRLQPESGKTA
ncbi:MAG: hypothetical protein RBS80_22565 [Thermoguttaceae bacterium]|nr:hypothetical protein [Thermoguttaceae bacterium]